MEKLKVMLVDDEALSMELLSRCIDWEANGMEIAAKLTRSELAMEAVDRLKPMIIISDINMPIINGLELGKAVLEKYPKIKFVLLTGYEEFEYAKHSVKLGISDFILKPICPEEILQSMNKLKKQIEEENKKDEDFSRLKKQIDVNFQYLKEVYLNKILVGNFSEEDAESAGFYKIGLGAKSFKLCLVELSHQGGRDEELRLIDSMAAKEAVSSFFSNNPLLYVFAENAGCVAVLCCDENVSFENELESLVGILNGKLDCNVTIGVGGKCANVRDIPELYKKAKESLSYKIVIGNNQVIYPEDIAHKAMDRGDFSSAQKEKICFYVKAGLPEEAVNMVFTYFDTVSGRDVDILSLKVNAIEIISLIFNNVWEIDPPALSNLLSECYEPIIKIGNIPDLKAFFKACILKISGTLEAEKDNEKNKQIAMVKNFLKENYSDYSVTLKTTADKFCKNASYLSRLFKQETGESFIEYLTRIRMEESVRLIGHSDMKIYEVCEAVGILDANYFGKCFRKYTGMTVSEYKKCVRTQA